MNDAAAANIREARTARPRELCAALVGAVRRTVWKELMVADMLLVVCDEWPGESAPVRLW